MGAQSKSMAPMTGKNGRLIFFQDSSKRIIDFKTWTVKPNVTKHNDGINGADADEVDITFNYWEISAAVFMRDSDLIRAYLESLEKRQTNTAPLDQSGAIRFYPNDGTRLSFILVGLCWDDFDVNQGGRSEKIMGSMSLRCPKMTEAKTF